MVREFWGADWTFSLVQSIREHVEKLDYKLASSWPLLRGHTSTIYEWAPGYRLIALVDAPGQSIPAIAGAPTPRPCPIDSPALPTVANVAALAREVEAALELRRQDCVFILPAINDATSFDDELARLSDEDLRPWQTQLADVINRHWHFMKGFDLDSGFFIPPGYGHLADPCQQFIADHPDYQRNVFLMTRLSKDKYLIELDEALRACLRANGLNPVRADDRAYPTNRNLWDNVCVYMIGCSTGVAILEDRALDEFNPNVGIEYGFMRALNKPALLLADVGFRNLRADVIGTIREEFDLLDLERTVPPAIERWLRDIGFAEPGLR